MVVVYRRTGKGSGGKRRAVGGVNSPPTAGAAELAADVVE